MKTKTTYRGFIIEAEEDFWATKYCGPIRYYIDGEKVHGASSIEDAKQQIDNKLYLQEPKWFNRFDQLVPFFIYIAIVLSLAVLNGCSSEDTDPAPKFDCELAVKEFYKAKQEFESIVRADPRLVVLTPSQDAMDEYFAKKKVKYDAYVNATRVISDNKCKK